MDAGFKDGYGQYLDRKQACYNQQNSLTLRVTDACPCHYPGNQYSNSRWWAPCTLYPTPATNTLTAAGGGPTPYTPDHIPCTPYTMYPIPANSTPTSAGGPPSNPVLWGVRVSI